MRHTLFGDGRIFDRLPVYELLQDVADEKSLSGRAGDIIIGGGSGETNALRFAIPEIFHHFTNGPDCVGEGREPPIISHWSENEAFIFCQGFENLGWDVERQDLKIWLAEHLMAFLVRISPNQYAPLVGEFPPELNGSIFINARPT
jgi:hypothetical protein